MAEGQFVAYGPSHWAVLGVTVLGGAALVGLARRGVPRWPWWLLAAAAALLNAATEVIAFRPDDPWRTLPLQLSDLAPYAAAVALVTRRRWACALTWYWGVVLSSQALLTPALRAPDFPGREFLAFFGVHALVVWAAVVLVAGLGERPSWPGYRVTVAATVGWAVVAFVVGRVTGANYGFLNARPGTPSLLDLMGPWPWYLAVEAALVLLVWAAMTWPWTRRRAGVSAAPGATAG